MNINEDTMKSSYHGTMNGYQYHNCRCSACKIIAAVTRKKYRNINLAKARANDRYKKRQLQLDPLWREKTNKRQNELYHAQVVDPIKGPKLREKQKQHYLNNREEIRATANARRKKLKEHIVNLLGGKCITCGITNHILLEFHHIDPSSKEFDLSKGLGYNWRSLERLENEAKKCELLCANCHRLKTHTN